MTAERITWRSGWIFELLYDWSKPSLLRTTWRGQTPSVRLNVHQRAVNSRQGLVSFGVGGWVQTKNSGFRVGERVSLTTPSTLAIPFTS
jgi:hypothetical protein